MLLWMSARALRTSTEERSASGNFWYSARLLKLFESGLRLTALDQLQADVEVGGRQFGLKNRGSAPLG